MIVNKILNYNSSRYSDDDHNGDIKEIDKDLITLFNCLQGRVRFGPGTSGNRGENIAGQFLTITTNSTPDTETGFTHGLGSIPIGYLVLGQNKTGFLYQLDGTGTKWNSNTIYLKCSVASVTFNLFLLQ